MVFLLVSECLAWDARFMPDLTTDFNEKLDFETHPELCEAKLFHLALPLDLAYFLTIAVYN
ncbi:hypothetical protein GCM10009426_35950 [Rheinheimera tangshanensis]|nr:hypothetical protein GCM10010920_09580 [Rheinheimera tangshanensis]